MFNFSHVGMALDGEPVRLYVGPKDYFVLEALPYDLVRIVPVGEWIGPVVVPLMRLLRFVHGHVGNYGWSIVVLTVMINLVMAPFRHMSISNSMKMAIVGVLGDHEASACARLASVRGT